MEERDDPLAHFPFTFKAASSGSLFLYYEGRQVVTLKGCGAERRLRRLVSAPSERERQLHLARATGNFQRGTKPAGRG